MNITKSGSRKVSEKNYSGVCRRCGCEFETKLKKTYFGDGSVVYRPMDSETFIQVINSTIVCDCPQCEMRTALREAE